MSPRALPPFEPGLKTAVPTITGALADNYGALRSARFDLHRAREMHGTARPEHIEGWWQRVLEAGTVVADLEFHRDRLLAALAAHELTWAHLTPECPICIGEVRLVNEDGRPF